MRTKTRALLAVALCAAAMFAIGARAALWTYDPAAQTLSHDETLWVLTVTADGTELTVTGVKTSGTSPSALPLGDAVGGGYAITAIADAESEIAYYGVFSGVGYYIGSLTFPSMLRTIGDGAFSLCASLTNVAIPDSVTRIGDGAFYFCESLIDMTLGTGVNHIDGSVFIGCERLINLSVSAGNTAYASVDGVLFSKDEKTLVLYPAGKTGKYSIFTMPLLHKRLQAQPDPEGEPHLVVGAGGRGGFERDGQSQYAKGGKTYIYCASKESRDTDFDNILLDLSAID